MPATRTSASVGIRSATSGAVKAAERLANDDHVLPVTDRVDHRVGVVSECRRFVVGGEVGGDHVVATATKLGGHQVPIPADVTCAVDQRERCSCGVLLLTTTSTTKAPTSPDLPGRSGPCVHPSGQNDGCDCGFRLSILTFDCAAGSVILSTSKPFWMSLE